MGMNVNVGRFDHAGLFRVVIALMLGIAALVVVAVRMRESI